MSFPFAKAHGIVRFTQGKVVGERDYRGELVRIRLSDADLNRVSAIQDYYATVGISPSMQRVIADGIDALYSALSSQGNVPPNL
jgi:hypothetical protein